MSERHKRAHVRTKLRAGVKVSHPETGDLSLHTADISDSGAYILTEGNTPPEVGEIVMVQLQGLGGGEAPQLMMRVMRSDKDGIGLEFVKDE